MENIMSGEISLLPHQGNAQVRLLGSDDIWLESLAVDQLVQVAGLPGLRFGFGMPDLHPGISQPIGAAFISENCLYPHLVGSDIGCGMGLWDLSVNVSKIKLDRWAKKLQGLDDELPARNNSGESPNRLGTIGGGNHFAEFQRVQEVYHPEIFSSAGLNLQSVVLLVHSGSRGLGQQVLQAWAKEHGAKAATGEPLTAYLCEHNKAVAWAKLNRRRIAERFCEALGIGANILLDICHNSVVKLRGQELRELEGLGNREFSRNKGSDFWLHRKGASPTSEGLVMIPGSRGSLSYLVRPNNDKALAEAGFSLAHGAGRKWKRSECAGRLKNHYSAESLLTTRVGSRVICANRRLIYEEAPQAYKNIDSVVEAMEATHVIDIVAAFRPVLTYKTRKKS